MPSNTTTAISTVKQEVWLREWSEQIKAQQESGLIVQKWCAENAIRPFVVGRKNWLFSNTENGAKCSAALYLVISTAQANGLDVEKYLTELFLSHQALSICRGTTDTT